MPIRTSIFTRDNGAGLSVDAQILSAELQRAGHEVQLHDLQSDPQPSPPDCVFFLEQIDFRFAGRFNVLVPNPEWLKHQRIDELHRFDLVACKTHEGQRIMSALPGVKAVYIGWTTLDRYRPAIARRFDECLHVAGRSSQKGTDAVLRAWKENPDFPVLNLVDWREGAPPAIDPPNVRRFAVRMAEEEFVELINRCAVHICPSETEGFGHTIHEALCCGAVLITTDAPPMNEIPANAAIRVRPVKQSARRLVTLYNVDAYGIARAVRNVLSVNEPQRQAMQQAARASWQQSRTQFEQAIAQLDRIIRQQLNQESS